MAKISPWAHSGFDQRHNFIMKFWIRLLWSLAKEFHFPRWYGGLFLSCSHTLLAFNIWTFHLFLSCDPSILLQQYLLILTTGLQFYQQIKASSRKVRLKLWVWCACFAQCMCNTFFTYTLPDVMVTRRGKAYLQAYNFSALKLTCSFNHPARLQCDHMNYNTWKHCIPSTCHVDRSFLFPSGPRVSTSLPGVLLWISTGLCEWEDPNRNRVGRWFKIKLCAKCWQEKMD